MNPLGTDARPAEVQACGRLKFKVQTVFQITKKNLSSSLATLHRPHLPALLAKWRKKVPGRMEHADMAMKVIVTSPFSIPIPFQLLFSGSALPVPPCDCDPSITQGCRMPEHPIVLSQYPRSAASEFRFKAVDHKLRRTGRIGREMVFYVHSLLY